MNTSFERTGPLMELDSYPQWAQEMVGECDLVKHTVVDHVLWDVMREEPNPEVTATFMVGAWPMIERFPGYMAQSLLKTRFGRSAGDNAARRWLVRNIRVEQNHAEHWLKWAEGSGVPREELLEGPLPPGTQVMADWCEEVSRSDSLAASVAAVNYAIEGATGEWAQILYDSESFAAQYPADTRKASLRWLQLHAAYDDRHPWEALEIVCIILGAEPKATEVAHVAECIKRSYTTMRIFGTRCVQPGRILEAEERPQVAAA
ncbi:MAG: iron-containing redox enzyme family protein [Gammaproteobacteria bacterium]|nr:iron-containing redox enzyme family protein [Gammaproteobacteria bacterium]